MAVPKRKMSKSKPVAAERLPGPSTRHRVPDCPRCHVAKRPHAVCGNCGWYKDRYAIKVD